MSGKYAELDPLLHSRLRLAIISILSQKEEADFNYLKNQTTSTSGNLSVQIDKLEKAGYITVTKSFKGKRPHTNCNLTKKGMDAFTTYIKNIQQYLNKE